MCATIAVRAPLPLLRAVILFATFLLSNPHFILHGLLDFWTPVSSLMEIQF